MNLEKSHPSSHWLPLEAGSVTPRTGAVRVIAMDGAGRIYWEAVPNGGPLGFKVRGTAGIHRVMAFDDIGNLVDEIHFSLRPRTGMICDQGHYADCLTRVANLMEEFDELQKHTVGGKMHRLCVCWLRDHTYTLKALRHYWDDVHSGTTLFLDHQQADGMIWDDIHRNESAAPAWFGEALGDGYFAYADGMKWLFRRIPIEADVEYIAVESVHHAWKASGDDRWLAAQLPRLERALGYSTSSPLRWSTRHGLIKRAYTMDSWDFKHPDPRIGGGGDHRRLNGPDQPFFLFHGDNSGLYAAYVRMAEMYRCLGDATAAQRHRQQADELRQRANALLWRNNIYAHMVAEEPIEDLVERVGNDDERMSLSLPYSVNRGLPDHAQSLGIIDEYRQRGKTKSSLSFAEWWSMDPVYTKDQWAHQPEGEYMNGAISPLVAGELSRAAFEHGREEYGADIIRRLWALTEQDGGHLADCYRQLPPDFSEPGQDQRQEPIDLRRHVRVGLRHGQTLGVVAWSGEGDNDLRGLPTGRQRLLDVDLEFIEPTTNGGRSVIALGGEHTDSCVIPLVATLGSFYVVHALSGSGEGTVGTYILAYADGSEHRFPLLAGREIANWWNPRTLNTHLSGPNVGRVVWRGANPTVRDVGVYLSGFANPYPEKHVAALLLQAAPGVRMMVCAVSIAHAPARIPRGIRSFGLPSVWSQAAIHHAIVEGLAGVEDTDRAFRRSRVSPRWPVTEVTNAEVCIHYPASDGYCAYRWRIDADLHLIEIDVTGNFTSAEIRILVPAGKDILSVNCDGTSIAVGREQIETSLYALVTLNDLPRSPLILFYS